MKLNGRLNAAVESDVVGYTTFTTSAGMNLVSITFNGVDGKAASIHDILSGKFADGDRILFYNTTTGDYDSCYYWDEVYVGDDCVGAGWGDGEQTKSTLTIAPGTAFWLKTKTATTVTVAGSVKVDAQTLACEPGMNLVGLSFPVALDLNKDLVSENLSDRDQVLIYDTQKGDYNRYYFWDEVYVGDDCVGKGWGDSEQTKVSATIPAGVGFWLKSAKSVNFTINSPIK